MRQQFPDEIDVVFQDSIHYAEAQENEKEREKGEETSVHGLYWWVNAVNMRRDNIF